MEKLADDLLTGVDAIAAFTGMSKRRVYYLAENRRLPLFKLGNQWTGRKSTLSRRLDEGFSEHGQARNTKTK